MAGYLGLKVVVYVPEHVHPATRDLIRGEGAEVRVVEGADYDAALKAAKRGDKDGVEGLLVMDIGWEGYEDVLQWVVEGYQTMLDEADEQALLATGGMSITHAIVPVGCGSIDQAVTKHFKNAAREQAASLATVLAVEPDTAACLKTSLEQGKMTTVTTQDSIMCGMDCGTLSTTAWPAIKSGVDGTIVVSDVESHGGGGTRRARN
ncbi:Diaminopropionate ammonia-lyase [Madurella mycetomatis]|uniref:Diaminopropionate ammonia-lyase n=1 Tax=Madurella mycetomatis TaxID=100816 RepID=A0A175W9Y0_9PEZI|nr:Diaminopropionate ammonia-lyase [Madurella mycetomatis]